MNERRRFLGKGNAAANDTQSAATRTTEQSKADPSLKSAWEERERGRESSFAFERSGSIRAEGADGFNSEPISKSKPSEAASIWERKKDAADVQFSRLLRKPRKRNGVAFF